MSIILKLPWSIRVESLMKDMSTREGLKDKKAKTKLAWKDKSTSKVK